MIENNISSQLNEIAEHKSTLQTIGDNISKVFRHILPGMFILSIAYASKPHWFTEIHIGDANHLILLFALSILVGNSWYVVNRYILALPYDFILSRKLSDGTGYTKWVSQHIININTLNPQFKQVREVIQI